MDNHGSFKSYHEIYFRNLHSYRKNKREDYISDKMDKVVSYCINKKEGLAIEDLFFEQEFSYGKKCNCYNFFKNLLILLNKSFRCPLKECPPVSKTTTFSSDKPRCSFINKRLKNSISRSSLQ